MLSKNSRDLRPANIMNRTLFRIARGLALFVVVAAIVTVTANLWNQPSHHRYVGEFVPKHQRIGIGQIDHTLWDRLLAKYVDSNGMVDYAAWKSNASDRQSLNRYLAELSRADHQSAADPHAKIAYWINAYNAVTIEGILQVYPTTSIRNHTPRLAGFNIWKHLLLYSGDQTSSLDDIEHKTLRKMDEPRIHFAIVCASKGCPRLLNEAYQSSQLEAQLTANAMDFFSRPQNLSIDPESRKLRLSSLIHWFGDDFGSTRDERMTYLRPFMLEAAQTMVKENDYALEFLPYDWDLNGQ